jgi:type VI secretion system secreted protein VgrG
MPSMAIDRIRWPASILALIGNRPVFTFSVAGADGELRVLRFTGREGVSTLYEFRLELACAHMIGPRDLVGRAGALNIEGIDEPRHVHGFIRRPSTSASRATTCSTSWSWSPRSGACRTARTAASSRRCARPDIIHQVLTEAGVPSDKFRFDLSGEYAPRNYCVQYRESDLDFISRLLEEDGIFYFFEHHDGQARAGDGRQGRHAPDHPGQPGAVVQPARAASSTTASTSTRSLRRVGATGRVSLRDFYFPTPDQHGGRRGLDRDPSSRSTTIPASTGPGPRRAGPRRDDRPHAARGAAGAPAHGQRRGDCMRLTGGFTFTLQAHPANELNRAYKLVRVVHHAAQPQVLDEDASGEFSYHNEFMCMESTVPFRPTRVTPRPFVRGIQSATVVGPPGEEIHTDEQGRVKVQFHWDRRGQHNEHSSCWIRVSQLWAGAGWGAMFLPRIGHEVLVDFIEGDPDRPIVTGRVYHGLNDTPYPLPQEKTKSTIKSDSSLGGGGYNEFRYEDRKGSEQIFMHAERDLDIHVKHDRMENVLHDRHLRVGDQVNGVKEGDFNELVLRDRHIRVDRHQHVQVGGDAYLHVGGIDGDGHQHVIVDANQYELVRGDAHHHVIGASVAQVNASASLVVGESIHVKVNTNTALQSGEEVHVKAPQVVIEAARGITLKGPGGFITIDASGVILQGRLVRVNSGGAALSGAGAAPVAVEDARTAEPLAPRPADRGAETK